MKILADENLPSPVVEALRSQGHDVLWARQACPGFKDPALLDRAEAEGRIVLTLDRDFWQLALQRPSPLKTSGVVLFRVHPAIPGNVMRLVDAMLQAGHNWSGHIGVVTPEGIEMLPTREK
jgi:predicted nuclease of predicted toxin-antitoxin system